MYVLELKTENKPENTGKHKQEFWLVLWTARRGKNGLCDQLTHVDHESVASSPTLCHKSAMNRPSSRSWVCHDSVVSWPWVGCLVGHLIVTLLICWTKQTNKLLCLFSRATIDVHLFLSVQVFADETKHEGASDSSTCENCSTCTVTVCALIIYYVQNNCKTSLFVEGGKLHSDFTNTQLILVLVKFLQPHNAYLLKYLSLHSHWQCIRCLVWLQEEGLVWSVWEWEPSATEIWTLRLQSRLWRWVLL